MISRVADNCFWLGRYLERTENTARVLFVTRNLALDGELSPEQCWSPVVIVCGEHEPFVARYGDDAMADGETVQRYMTWEHANLSSIRSTVGAARENARSIREVVSLETWECLNELYLWLGSDAAREAWSTERYGFYRQVRRSVQLTVGTMRSTMLHDTPLDFIRLGVMLERAGQTARILDHQHHALTRLSMHQVIETALWLSLLRACSGFEPFMKRWQGRVNGRAVANFLMLEPKFPRSVRYCVRSAFDRLRDIREGDGGPLPGALVRLHALDAWLGALSPETLSEADIHEALTHVVNETAAICAGVTDEVLGLGGPTSDAPVPVAAPAD